MLYQQLLSKLQNAQSNANNKKLGHLPKRYKFFNKGKGVRSSIWNEINNNVDALSFNNNNIGTGEMMVPNFGHIMMELALPLCVHLGVSNIILSGFVGGDAHGTKLTNEISWDSDTYRHHYMEQERNIIISKKLSNFFVNNFKINLYCFGKTFYNIDKINESEFCELIN